MAWLLRETEVLAALETDRSAFSADLRGALLLRRRQVVHTLYPALDLDVAWCDERPGATLEVLRVAALKRRRLARPRRAPAVVLAPAGAFERWNLKVGDRLEVKGG